MPHFVASVDILLLLCWFFSLIGFYVVSFFAFSLILDMLFRADKGVSLSRNFMMEVQQATKNSKQQNLFSFCICLHVLYFAVL